ncbi:hypothetical protein Tco_0409344 [Tanacetum coccineum]
MKMKDILSLCSDSEEQQMQAKAKESCMSTKDTVLEVHQLRFSLDDDDGLMTCKYFLAFTRTEVQQFHDTLIQHMESVKKSIDERALHKREYDNKVNEKQMQTKERKVDTSKTLDASLVDTENIRPIYDEEPKAEVQLTADNNVFSIEQQHTEQPEFNNKGEEKVFANAALKNELRKLKGNSMVMTYPPLRLGGIRHAKPYTLRGGPLTKLGQSEDYDEEREIELRLEPARAVTPPLRAASPKVRKRREIVVGFEETQNKGESRVERNSEGGRHSEEASRGNGGGNLPPYGMFLSHNSQPFIPASLNGQPPTTCEFYQWTAHGLPSTNSDGKPPYRGNLCQPPPMYVFPNMPVYANPNPTGLFPNHLGLVTPFIRWIEDYPIPDGLKMPSYIGSYNGKGDPDNFLHLFKGAIRMQKWLMLVACHMFTYTLKDSARIWWNSQRAGSILDYEDLKAKF